VQHPEDARWDAVAFGPSLTVLRGTFLGQKTADMKMYPFVTGAGDGTQNAKGISMYDLMTDANGKVFFGPSITPSARAGSWYTAPMFIKGIFDPEELQTAATPAGEVDTFTPANVGVGNVFTLTATQRTGATTVINYTAAATTAADVVTGLTALVSASNDPVFANVTPSGTVTLILTSKNLGTSFSIASSATGGTATFTRAVTTAASGRVFADILTSFPGSRVLHNGYWDIK
jgi:hypothetical protein